MEFREHLLDGLNDIIGNLEGGHARHDSEQLSIRLTALCEAALVNREILLEAIDFMDHARRLLNVTTSEQQGSFSGYQGTAACEGRRERPKLIRNFRTAASFLQGIESPIS